ncbi:MAG: hypothetical protein IPK82_00845 [Polyangiaceae bacterium]|nr:hypothetical protein [Polyangiaceae bacterium]
MENAESVAAPSESPRERGHNPLIREAIAHVIARRREQLPRMEAKLEAWRILDRRLEDLEIALDDMLLHPSTPVELRGAVNDFRHRELRHRVAECVSKLAVVRGRMSRSTVNIGVSGQARVGKSTLLQSIAGLGEEQIPTGEGIPVTAVRSRIFHSTTHARATVTLHTYASFRRDVLAPYHRELGLSEPADSLDAFRRATGILPDETLAKLAPSQRTLAKRLRDMVRALPSYEGLLVGGEREIPLAELRSYVAYPSKEQEDENVVARPYLAVRDVRIECAFPRVDVDGLALIDLPGLGELAAGAEEHHVHGLRHEVDVVLLVKRPVEGMAYWSEADGKAVDLLDRARGAIRRRWDFVFLVSNQGGAKASLVDAMLGSIRRDVNEGQDGLHYQVLGCDAKDPRSVYEDLLAPVLEHLANRLAAMDAEVLVDAIEQTRTARDQVRLGIDDLMAAVREHAPEMQAASEELWSRVSRIQKDLAVDLGDLVSDLLRDARVSTEDTRFVAAVTQAYGRAKTCVDEGFGMGKDAWIEEVLRTMRRDKNSTPVAARELNRARVYISEQFCEIDRYFDDRVNELWNRIAQITGKHFGGLFAGASGVSALKLMAKLLDEASEPCPVLSTAVQNLLRLEIRYRSHLHPRVRRCLDTLNLEVKDPETGELRTQVTVETSQQGAEMLQKRISQLVQQAAWQSRKALLEDANTAALVLHAAAEQFEDSFIRSGDSEREFLRLGRSYRDEIWPGVFSGLDAKNARIAKVRKECKSVLGALFAMESDEAA